MRSFALTLTILLSLVAAPVLAQTEDDIELMRTILQTEKKILVAKNMNLTDPESVAFWPVYNQYQEELRSINGRMIELLQAYAKSYGTLSDEKAEEMLKEFLDIQNARLKLKKSYVKKVGKALPPQKVFRYYQVENKIEAVINFDLARSVPLAQ